MRLRLREQLGAGVLRISVCQQPYRKTSQRRACRSDAAADRGKRTKRAALPEQRSGGTARLPMRGKFMNRQAGLARTCVPRTLRTLRFDFSD